METQKNLNSELTLEIDAGGDNTPRHATEYQQFIEWVALPVKERNPQTQKELAEQFGLSEWTLSQWKLRDGFWVEVEKTRKTWAKGKTSEVLHGLYQKAMAGGAAEVKLWLEYVEGFVPKNRSEINATTKDITDEAFQLRLNAMIKRIQSGAYPESTIHPHLDNAEPIRINPDFYDDPDLPISYKKLGLIQ